MFISSVVHGNDLLNISGQINLTQLVNVTEQQHYAGRTYCNIDGDL